MRTNLYMMFQCKFNGLLNGGSVACVKAAGNIGRSNPGHQSLVITNPFSHIAVQVNQKHSQKFILNLHAFCNCWRYFFCSKTFFSAVKRSTILKWMLLLGFFWARM